MTREELRERLIDEGAGRISEEVADEAIKVVLGAAIAECEKVKDHHIARAAAEAKQLHSPVTATIVNPATRAGSASAAAWLAIKLRELMP